MKRTTTLLLKTIAPRILVLFAMLASGCKHNVLPSLSTGGHDYQQVNLVADTAGYNAARLDATLNNPWGIAISSTGTFWIAVNHSGSTAVYDSNGNQKLANVDIPLGGEPSGSSPDGVVHNTTTDFVVDGSPAKYIYVTEDGIVSCWVAGDTTVMVAASTTGAVYKGVAIANDGTGNFLYATDFYNATIDVYDASFHTVMNKPFSDPNIPGDFAPFNIRNIGGKLFVTYAKQQLPDRHDDQGGMGNGYVDVFTPDGILRKRFATQGSLNSPWGIAQAQAPFGQGANAILISNFGDGTINVFDSAGNYQGPLENNGTPIFIDGLWDIAFSPTSTTKLYFTAGPQLEEYGLFGYLKIK